MEHKITFADQISTDGDSVDPEKQILSEVYYVESFKKYN